MVINRHRFDSLIGSSMYRLIELHFSSFHLSGLLTKKFINLIKHAEDGVLDLNKAADMLEVIVSSN